MLAPREGERMLDLTVGAGGHSARLLEAVGTSGLLVGVDRDRDILVEAQQRLGDASVRLVHGYFGDLPRLREQLVEAEVESTRFDGILADIGVSSLQLDRADRGFSFRSDGPLDMRMNRDEPVSAKEYLRTVSVDELTRVISEYGEERHARRVAREIVSARDVKEIETTSELAEIVRRVLPRPRPKEKDPATRTFQAIRIAVNRELEALDHLLERFGTLLAPGGRFAVISFHSLEDRRVKQAFRDRSSEGDFELLTAKAVRPSAEEVARNPRARSARLRALRKKSVGER